MVQNSSEVTGGGCILGWSGPCSLQGLMDGGVFKQPTCRKFACWLASEADAGGAGVWGFALGLNS